MDINDLILDKLDKLDSKIDKMAEETIPKMMVDVARLSEQTKAEVKDLNAKTSSQAKLYTLIGGGIATLISVGTAVAMSLLK